MVMKSDLASVEIALQNHHKLDNHYKAIKKQSIRRYFCAWCGKSIREKTAAIHSNIYNEPKTIKFCRCKSKQERCIDNWIFYKQGSCSLQQKVLEVLDVNYPKDLTHFEIASTLKVNQSLVLEVLESLVKSESIESIENKKRDRYGI